MVRLLKQLEEECLPDYDKENPDNFLHHEQGLASQKTFQRQVDGLCGYHQTNGQSLVG